MGWENQFSVVVRKWAILGTVPSLEERGWGWSSRLDAVESGA
jgi:hypothetical protein